jgi:hypothetical protein
MKNKLLLILLLLQTAIVFAQNVGIGVANPAAKLDVRHLSSITNPTLLLYDNNSSNYSRLQFQNSSGPKYWTIAGYLNNTTDASSRLNFYHSVYGDVMTLTGDGKVGIGWSPLEKLDVYGNINLTGALKLNQNAGTPGQVLVSNGTSSTSWGNLPAGASVWTVSGNNIYNNNIGRVGIGLSTAPQGQLEVKMNSGAEPHILLNESDNDYSRLTYKNVNGVSFTTGAYTSVGSATDNYNIYSHKKSADLLKVTSDPKSTVVVNGSLQLKKVFREASIGFGNSSVHNNIDIGDASVVEFGWDNLSSGTGANPGEITGIAGGVEGRIIYIFKRDQGYRTNAWDNNFYRFTENDTRSLPENRFAFQNIDLDNFDGLTLIYLNGRWRCLGRYD